MPMAFLPRNGRWPVAAPVAVAEAPEESWGRIDRALRRGERGLPGLLRADYSHYGGYDYEELGGDVTGRAGRVLALSGALVAGVVLAILVIPEFGPWLNGTGLFHHHH